MNLKISPEDLHSVDIASLLNLSSYLMKNLCIKLSIRKEQKIIHCKSRFYNKRE